MIALRSLATISPHAAVSPDETQAMLRDVLPCEAAERASALVAASGIRRRSAVARLRRLARLGGVAERNAHYAAIAVPLAERVARLALAAASLDPAAVEAVVVASSTGHLVPTVAHHLAARLGVAPATPRLSCNDLGCTGAVRGLAAADDLLRGTGRRIALVVTAELCSLWWPCGELSPQDVRSSVLMGDGAGAAVVAVGASTAAGVQILASQSVLWPDSLDARGATLTSTGLRHFASPRIARVVARHLSGTVDEFLAAHGVTRRALAFCAVNPSELPLATAIADHLALPGQAGAIASLVWAQHGNTLAAGPLHVLRTLAGHAAPMQGALGLLVVLGPGVTCDLLLLRWGGVLPTAHCDETTPALS